MGERDRVKPPDIIAAERKMSQGCQGHYLCACAVLGPHIQELYRRIAELEAQPYLREAGVWEQDKAYGVGMVVTDHGSAWVCKQVTCQRPGESDHWRLLAKRGRDGKGAARPIGPIVMRTMREARLNLLAAIATHPARMENLMFDVAEMAAPRSSSAKCRTVMTSPSTLIFRLSVDPDDEDERRRLMAEFSRAHIVAV